MKTVTDFLWVDWPLRWNGVQGDLNTIKSAVQNALPSTLQGIQSQLSQLLGQSGGTGNLATRDDVNNAKNQLNEILMIMLGFAPCPAAQAPPGFCTNFGNLKKLGGDTTEILIGLNNANNTLNNLPSLNGILIGLNSALDAKLQPLQTQIDELQATLDNTASQSLDVRAVQVDSGDPKKLRWIVKTTRDGALVNASLSRFATVRGYSAMSNVMGNAVVTSLGTGLHDVVLSVSKEAPEGVAYLFEASLTAGGSTVQGSALLVTEKKGASPF